MDDIGAKEKVSMVKEGILNKKSKKCISSLFLYSGEKDVERKLVLGIGLLIVLKMMLMANEEIIAFYLPHDDLWQMLASKIFYWGGSYRSNRLFHFPIYPIFVELVNVTGIPLRVATDLVQCGCAAFLTIAFFKSGIPAFICFIADAVMLFHPASFQLPNRCGPEVLLTPLMMGAIGAAILWFIGRDKKGSVGRAIRSGIWWALVWNVRKESFIVVVIFAICGIYIFLLDHKSAGFKNAARRVLIGMGIPLLLCIIVAASFKTLNKIRWGLYSSSIITSSGFTSAFNELQRIKPEKYIGYTPITSDVRQKAYMVSPMLSKLKPYFEGEIGRGWSSFANEFYRQKQIKVDGLEIAAGWIYWALQDAANAAGYNKNPTDNNNFWLKVADELKAARKSGKYSTRPVLVTFIDPDIKYWFPRVPASIARIAERFILPAVPDRPLQDMNINDIIGDKFDRQANRRAYLIPCKKGRIQGWIKTDSGDITNVQLITSAGKIVSIAYLSMRLDIDRGRPTGFTLKTYEVCSKEEWANCNLLVNFSGGTQTTFRISDLKPIDDGKNAGQPKCTLAVDYCKYKDVKYPNWKIEQFLEKYYLALTRFASYLIVPALLLITVLMIAKRHFPNGAFILLLLMSAIAARGMLFVLLDATSWDGNQPRYLYPVMPLYNALLVVAFWMLIELFITARNKKVPKCP
jgi:hypothetical protein